MDKKTQLKHFDTMVARMRDILEWHGDTYAGTDRLSNFKRVGAMVGTSPETSCLDKIATKVARLGTLFTSPGAPKNESIEDSIIDLANYAILLHMVVADTRTSVDFPPLEVNTAAPDDIDPWDISHSRHVIETPEELETKIDSRPVNVTEDVPF